MKSLYFVTSARKTDPPAHCPPIPRSTLVAATEVVVRDVALRYGSGGDNQPSGLEIAVELTRLAAPRSRVAETS